MKKAFSQKKKFFTRTEYKTERKQRERKAEAETEQTNKVKNKNLNKDTKKLMMYRVRTINPDFFVVLIFHFGIFFL